MVVQLAASEWDIGQLDIGRPRRVMLIEEAESQN
jgi:hypothetical protein